MRARLFSRKNMHVNQFEDEGTVRKTKRTCCTHAYILLDAFLGFFFSFILFQKNENGVLETPASNYCYTISSGWIEMLVMK